MFVVADDLSGAVETAAVLGIRRITLSTRGANGAVLDLDSRARSAADAARRTRALPERPAFKKIDSQLRGNIAAELEALGGDVIVAPALPVEGRIVRGGVLYVNGEPRTSPVPLVDAETDADLDAIVERAGDRTLVGSAGLAAALGRSLGVEPLPAPEPARGPLLIAVGTRAATEQLVRLAATGVPIRGVAGSPFKDGIVAVRGKALQIAAFVAAAPKVDLVLTGGATARRTLEALHITELRTLAQVHHGAVLCEGGCRRILIRPGSFGGPDSLVRIVEALTC